MVVGDGSQGAADGADFPSIRDRAAPEPETKQLPCAPCHCAALAPEVATWRQLQEQAQELRRTLPTIEQVLKPKADHFLLCYLLTDAAVTAAKTAALEIGGAVSEIGIGKHDIVC